MAEVKKPFDPQQPLREEDEALPSQQLTTDYETQKSDSYTKHLADSIRMAHPELGDASDQEAFGVVHKVEVPDASPDEYWKVLGNLYGNSWVPPKEPPMVSITEPSQLGSVLADIPVATWQDISAIPKGISEMVEGVSKAAGGQMQTLKGLAFGQTPAAPSQELQESEELLEKSTAHLARGGAFAAGLLAAEATGGLVNPVTMRLGSKFLPKLAGQAAKGAATLGGFMGTYQATREAAKPDPSHTWEAFKEGAVSGAKFGGVLGAAAGIVHPIIKAANSAGIAAANAKTFSEGKQAAAKFASVFEPEWSPSEIPPADFAYGVISELHGEDVAKSEAGKKAIEVIVNKIKTYRDNLIKGGFPEQKGTGFLEGESPQAAALKKQEVRPEGPVWLVGIKTKPGTIEAHNVFAETQEAAVVAAKEKAKELGGTVSGEITPQYERQRVERRVSTGEPPVEERRVGPRREEEVQQLKEINEQAKVEATSIDTMDRDSLLQKYEQDHPGQPLAYEDTEQLRDFMRREAQSRIQGSSSLIPAQLEVPKAQLEMAPKAEVTKAIVNPKFEDEFMRLKESGATDAEIEHVLRKSYQDRYGLASEMATQEPGKVYAGFDPSLIRKLASRMYQQGLGKIIPKELVQNSIDSVRGRPGGKISVEARTGPDNRWIMVTDNGTGMSPEIIKRELVDLGSSAKPEGSSGGFGLAKAALFANAKHIEVYTIAEVNGKFIETTLKGSGEDWANPKKGLSIHSKEIDPSKAQGTGTSIKLEFPRKDVEGNDINWSGLDLRAYGRKLTSYNQLDIAIDYKIDNIPVEGLKMKPELIKTFKTPGADIDFYKSGMEAPSQFPHIEILNNGIPQFDLAVMLNESVPLPSNLIANIKSTVDPSSPHYPFTTSREAITPYLESMLKKYVGIEMNNEAIIKEAEVFKNVFESAPKIGQYKVVDPSASRPPEIMSEISNTPSYEPFLNNIQVAFDIIQKSLEAIDSAYKDAKLTGFSTGEKHLGINVNGPKTTGESFNHILINPWVTMDEVLNRVKVGVTKPDNIVKDFVGQLISTIEHELTHQMARGHDVHFAGELTRNIGHIGKNVSNALDEIVKGVQNEPTIIATIIKHLEALRSDDARGTGTNIFAKVSDTLTGRGKHSSDPGIPSPSKKGRIESEEAVPSGDVNEAGVVSTWTSGTGSLSPVDRARLRFDIPPKGEEARKAYEVWKQSVLKQHDKSIKKFTELREMEKEK